MTTDPTLSEAQLAAAALTLLAQPRLWDTLRLRDADAEHAAEQPWSAYWSARRDTRLLPLQARAVHAAACTRFEELGDRTGELLALAALIETFYVDEGSLHAMDTWIARLQHRLPADGEWASRDLEAQVMACGLAITLRDQTHPLLQRWAARGAVLLRHIAPGAVRIKLATFLLQYHLWRGEFGRTSMIVDSLPGLDPAGVLPAEAIVWHESAATHARFTGQFDKGRQEVAAALALAQAHGLHGHGYALHAHGAALALAALDGDAAQVHIDAMRPSLESQAQDDQTHYWHFHTGLALLRGQAAAAVECARMTLANSLEIGGPYRTAAHRFSLGQALLEQGDAPAALEQLDEAVATARQIDAGLLVYSAQLSRSEALFRCGLAEASLAAAQEAFELGAHQGYRCCTGWWLPATLGRTAARALAAGIETDFVRRFVRQGHLPCPQPELAAWPWRLSVRVFGDLHVEREGTPLKAEGGKTARRPLELLAALVAHAPAPMPAAVALQWLWPEADDAGAQRKAFDAALRRLRRLLGDDTLLRLEGGRLSLDPAATWSDVGALASLAQHLAQAPEAGLPQLQGWTVQLLDLMRGPFLAESAAPWAEAARQHQRQRFARAVTQLADALSRHDAAHAVQLLERALDLDPGIEALARRLIELHAHAGDLAAAQRVLRTTAAMLHLQTGLPLSPPTRELADRLGLSPR